MAQFPKVRSCITCDFVREETAGKLTLMGMSGVLPEVTLSIKDFSQIINITFVVATEPAETTANVPVSVEILKGNATVLAMTQVFVMDLERGRPALMAIQLATKYPSPGQYKFRIYADGTLAYGELFNLQQAAL